MTITVDRKGLTSCCKAQTTYVDDGGGGWVEVCKGCLEDVDREW